MDLPLHDDHDHIGNLEAALELCPQATLVGNWSMTSRLGGDLPLPPRPDAVARPGRVLRRRRPDAAPGATPLFHSPATRGLFDERTGVLWAVDTFGAEWLDGATSASPGARFRGRNQNGRTRWSRTCEVVVAEPGRGLQFRTIPTRLYPDSSMWTFDLEAVEGGTRITQRFDVLRLNPVLDRLFHALIPAHRDRSAALRADVERLAAVASRTVPEERTGVR